MCHSELLNILYVIPSVVVNYVKEIKSHMSSTACTSQIFICRRRRPQPQPAMVGSASLAAWDSFRPGRLPSSRKIPLLLLAKAPFGMFSLSWKKNFRGHFVNFRGWFMINGDTTPYLVGPIRLAKKPQLLQILLKYCSACILCQCVKKKTQKILLLLRPNPRLLQHKFSNMHCPRKFFNSPVDIFWDKVRLECC